MKVELITVTPNAEEKIVEIARVSSKRKDKKSKPEGLINYLIKHSHWSPFEHAFMTLEIETSKAIGIQLNIPKNKTWLMPGGSTREELIPHYPGVIDKALEMGYNFCPRAHIIAFDDKRAV